MNIAKPKVSVLLPVYQGERYLRAAIDSILSQTFTNFEFIIVDDASTDRSLEIIRSYGDARIRVIWNDTNLGLIATLNKGLEVVRGEYVARMDQDDMSLPERLAKQVEFMDSRPELAASGTWARDIDEDGILTVERHVPFGEELEYQFWRPSPIIHPSAFIRRAHLGELRYSDDAPDVEDYELWLRLWKKYKIDNLPEELLLYRIHPDSITQSNRNRQLASAHKVFCRHTGLTVSLDDFFELIGAKEEPNQVRRALMKWRLARSIGKPYRMYLREDLVDARNRLRRRFGLGAIKQRFVRVLYHAWQRVRHRRSCFM